jgi:hypothetical protein
MEFKVRIQRRPGKVEGLGSLEMSCQCKDFLLHGGGCKHIGSVLWLIRQSARHESGMSEGSVPAVVDESYDAVRKAADRVAAREQDRKLDAESLVFLRAKATRLQTTLRERQASPVRKNPKNAGQDLSPAKKKPESKASETQTDARLLYRDSREASGAERGQGSTEGEGARLQLRDCLTASGLERGGGIGTVVSIPGAQESHEVAIRLIDSAEQYVRLLGFTFDRVDVTESLKRAKSRGVDVAVGVDRKWTLNGKTREQLVRLKELDSHGVLTRVVVGGSIADEYRAIGRAGIEGMGILHAKAIHTDVGSLIGSANWTTSSRCNVELGVEVSLHDLAAAELKDYMTAVIEGGDTVMDAEVLAAQRSRSESVYRRRGWT